MNQTIQEAAEARAEIYAEHHYPENMPDNYEGFEMRKAFCHTNFSAGFIHGAEWAQPKWIPVTERLPEELVPVLALVPEEDNEIAICLYEKKEGFYLSYDLDFKPNVEFWCLIPDSLLNFKP